MGMSPRAVSSTRRVVSEEVVRVPVPATRLIGRKRELAALTEGLSRAETRLLTLTGPAGVGKTRLAVEVARHTDDLWADGVVFVSLAPVRKPGDVVGAIIRALGLSEKAPARSVRAFIAALRDRRMLLVLDNFEQVMDATPVVSDILSACAGVTVLATSRSALRILAERAYPVSPLEVPAPGSAGSVEDAAGYGGVALFVERVRALDPAFALREDNLASVRAICARVEGLPLAIELAASRTRVLPPPAIAAGLERRLPLLSSGPRDLPARQRTMRNAIAWSWDLLEPVAGAVLERLCVFIGGWSLDAAAAVCGSLVTREQMLDVIDDLVTQSLIELDPSGPDEARYRMLEIVREYGSERLDPDARAESHDLHANYFLERGEEIGRELSSGRYGDRLDLLERDRFNFHVAIESLVQRRDADRAQRLCLALRSLWYVRGPLGEGRAFFDSALALDGAEISTRARALAEASTLARQHGDVPSANQLAADAVEVSRRGNNAPLLAHCLLQMGFNAHLAERFAFARAALEESLGIAVAHGDELAVARARHHLGFVAYFGEGDVDGAVQLQLECLDAFRGMNAERQVATALIALAELARAGGQHAVAQERLEEAMEILVRLRDLPLVVFLLAPAAALAADLRRYERSLCLSGASEALQRLSSSPTWPALERIAKRSLDRAERSTGSRYAAELRRRGARLKLAELGELIQTPDSTGAPPDPLTPREREIAAHLAEGMTNRQVAEALVISERTVDGHVANILGKLGFHNRSQVAAWIAARNATESPENQSRSRRQQGQVSPNE